MRQRVRWYEVMVDCLRFEQWSWAVFAVHGSLMFTVEDPRFFTASSLGGVDDQGAFAQRDPSEPAGNDDRLFSVEYKGTKIDMATSETLALAVRRMAGQ